MKKQTFAILLITVSLLFTSCLADTLNKKFGLTVPVFLYYSSDHAKSPARKKIPTGQPLTEADLPELSEAGYYFGGWYTDSEYTNPIQPGIILEDTTRIYALWIPRSDTPFTIQCYFLDPRKYGDLSFHYEPVYDQILYGTTDTEATYDYDPKYTPEYSSELDKYWSIFIQDYEDRIIKGNGSTVITIYYYLYKIYDNELRTMLSALNDYRFNLHFDFLESVSGYCNFSEIKNAIDTYCKLEGTWFDEYEGRTRKSYNKYLELDFGELSITEIPSYAFYQTGAILWVSLPSTCTYIGQGAFYGCDGMYCIWVSNNDPSRTWRSSNGVYFGSDPDFKYMAEVARSNEYVYLWLE